MTDIEILAFVMAMTALGLSEYSRYCYNKARRINERINRELAEECRRLREELAGVRQQNAKLSMNIIDTIATNAKLQQRIENLSYL